MPIKFFAHLIVTATILCSCRSSKPIHNGISKETAKIVRKIERVNELMSSSVGYSGERPQHYDNFIDLKIKANKNELLALTDHSNGVVRCYAFWALSLDSTTDLFPIVTKHITDTQIVRTQRGCIGSATTVGDFFISVVTPNQIDLRAQKFDSLEFVKLDSILIYSNTEIWAKSKAIARAKQSDNLYTIVRKLVIENKDPSAIVTLAKYKRTQDIPLILNSKNDDSYYFTFEAIKEFPDPKLLPFLEKNMVEAFDDSSYTTEWAEMYSAIAQYKNIEALDMLKRPFKEAIVSHIRGYHMSYIFAALQENKDPLYDSLLWDLWEFEGKISVNVYKYLSNKNPSKAFTLTKKTINTFDGLYNANNSYDPENEDNKENLAVLMLEQTLKQERDFGLEIIRKNILEMSVHVFPVFAEKASELKDKSFIEPLFQRLEIEDNPHVYLDVVKTLIKFNDPEINHRIVVTITKNKALNEGWGAGSLDEILKENKIE